MAQDREEGRDGTFGVLVLQWAKLNSVTWVVVLHDSCPRFGMGVGAGDFTHIASVPQVLVAEGLHPFHDERVRDLMDVKIYLDISDDVKIAWKIQRDMKERGHSLESIKASIAARKHDFDAYIDPQKKHADIIIQV